MRKLFTLIFAIALIFTFTGMAAAFGGYVVDPELDPQCAFNADGKVIPNGGAFGMGGAVGVVEGGAFGGILNGTVSGDVDLINGALTNTDAYRFGVPGTDRSIGVGSFTGTYSITGASADIYTGGPEWYGGFLGANFATIEGFTAQGSLNVSCLGPSPLYFWESDGHTGGIAGQGSLGSFEGFATADILFGAAGAIMGAEIEMIGYSYSDSYRYVDWNNGAKTEGMGTDVGAGTTVNASGYDRDWDDFLAYGYANVDGGWTAAGFAATTTIQNGASAYAAGSYSGSGSLNDSYTGSAIGYSGTSVTTVTGMHGSITTATAGMSVTSVTP